MNGEPEAFLDGWYIPPALSLIEVLGYE